MGVRVQGAPRRAVAAEWVGRLGYSLVCMAGQECGNLPRRRGRSNAQCLRLLQMPAPGPWVGAPRPPIPRIPRSQPASPVHAASTPTPHPPTTRPTPHTRLCPHELGDAGEDAEEDHRVANHHGRHRHGSGSEAAVRLCLRAVLGPEGREQPVMLLLRLLQEEGRGAGRRRGARAMMLSVACMPDKGRRSPAVLSALYAIRLANPQATHMSSTARVHAAACKRNDAHTYSHATHALAPGTWATATIATRTPLLSQGTGGSPRAWRPPAAAWHAAGCG